MVVRTVVWILVLALASPAVRAAVVFSDDFDDGVVAPEYTSIGGATLSEAGGRLMVTTTAPGQGVRVRYPAGTTNVNGSMLQDMILAVAGLGDWIRIEQFEDDGGGEVLDSTVTLMKTSSITILTTDRSGTSRAFTIDGRNPEDVVEQRVGKLSGGTERQYEVRFKDGSWWFSPPYAAPVSQTVGFDITTSLPMLAIGSLVADDVYLDPEPLPEDAAMVVTDLVCPAVDGGPPDEVDVFEALVGADRFDIETLDPGSVTLQGYDSQGNPLGSVPLGGPGHFSQFENGVWRLHFEDVPLAGAGCPAFYNLRGTAPGPDFGWIAGGPAVVDPDPLQTLRDLGVYFDVPVDLVVSSTGPHLANGVDQALVTIQALHRFTGLPVNGLAIEVYSLSGIDEGVHSPVAAVPLGGGLYEVTSSTTWAGETHFVALASENGGAGESFTEFTPGSVVELTLEVEDYAFPDGVAEVTVTVPARDRFGNAVAPPLSNLVVSSPVPYTVSVNGCNEYEVRLTSTIVGAFGVQFTETTSGMVRAREIHFPVVGPRAPNDDPIVAIDELLPTEFTVPVELYVHPGWDFNTVQIETLLGPGLSFADVVGVSDPDPGDRFDVLAFNVVAGGPCQPRVVSVTLGTNGPAPVGAGEVARFGIDLLADPVGVPVGAQLGKIGIRSVQADAPHPIFDPPAFGSPGDMPIDGDTSYIIKIQCSKKDWWKGCIIYARAQLPQGDTQPTDAQICRGHNNVNAAWAQCCISFDKQVTNVIVSGADIEEDIGALGPSYEDAEKMTLDALTAAGISRGNCIVMLHAKFVADKAATNDVTGVGFVQQDNFGTRTLPHEVGHTVGQDHDTAGGDVNNLMTPTDGGKGTGTKLTPAQCATARGSSRLTKRTLTWYDITFCPWESLDDQSNDSDGDGLCDAEDNCPSVPNVLQEDLDLDAYGDGCDNCLDTFNPEQEDQDGDGTGFLCDPCPADVGNDADGDAVCGNADNCPGTSNPGQADADADGLGDACDACPVGQAAFGETILAQDPNLLVWGIPEDVSFVKGILESVDSYSVFEQGDLFGATAIDMSADLPAPDAGFFYLVRPVGPCTTWQTTLGAEPGRDAAIPIP